MLWPMPGQGEVFQMIVLQVRHDQGWFVENRRKAEVGHL